MKPRNVILSLVLVLLLLAFVIVNTRFFEPKRKLTFNRNPSRIKYTEFALCRMDCYHISANDVTGVIRNGEIDKERSDLKKRPCPVFKILGHTKKGMVVWITVEQCGKMARILNCYHEDGVVGCGCTDKESPPVSYNKNKHR